ncbi:MAG: phosphomannomutase/phosphoglucomutase [Phycisphaeraceae bacterium]|nr:MAG: phosphomannomutase/phosphoglucomutase [Phycisphaeraceae bacterium]
MLGNAFKAYDIRGVYPDLITEKMAWQIGYGASTFLLAEAAGSGQPTPMLKNVVVGRDMRTSSPSLAASLAEGITDQGGSVIDVGLVDTPFIYFAINRLDCAGGIMTTASHNPPQYNGFKISRRKAKPVGEATGLAEIRKAAAMADPNKHKAEPDAKGRIEERDLWDAYIQHVHTFLETGGAKLKVVVDASNGMAGTMAPKVFGRRGEAVEGLEIIELYYDNTKGEFVHPPDPLVKANLKDVRERVVKEGADLGVCFDGDADRCMIIDEKGEVVGCDHLTAWLASWFLKKSPGSAIAYDLRSSKAVEEEVKKAGGKPVRGRVGHVFMKQALAEHNAVFGGELSGHFYFRDNFNCDSGAIALATVLTALAASNKPMSKIIKPIASRYTQSGEINFTVEDKDEALRDLKARFANEGEIDELDGVTVDCFESAGWWCNVRKSNTEPLLRLNIEARNQKLLDEMLEEIAPMLGERSEH